ncbi:unnamed protein product [Rhizophagus irregularis]|uniref:HTH myb-type domain-containing protein n=1 Tax=Rhizophagus irregularis TaxID=588596 RepID=A0A2I1GP04_9GLOM|nr:hypothetical protein RhiirA4_463965 [Rhizophagus irregularis]CAB4408011.1 unnamed protein product [Rhizophagus irregularis]CAB4408545.1 unnamed protein product [Rhizophagus irregularis]
MGKTSQFNDKEDTLIINYMYYMEKKCNYKCDYYKFVKISESMPKYTPKQISNHWRNHLYPNLCHWKSKKNSIVKRIKQRLKSKILIENYYNYENNVYCDNEKNHTLKRPRKHQTFFKKLMIHDTVNQLNKRRKFRNSSQKTHLSNSRKVAPQQFHVKQEHQKFNVPLPSSNNVSYYTPSSQNDSSSRVTIESLLHENNYFPGMNEVAKEYYSTV